MMMFLNSKCFLLVLVVFCTIMAPPLARAQNTPNSEVRPLDEILNATPDGTKPEDTKVASDYANDYYKACAAKKHSVYTKQEQEILCGCSASKMSEVLTLDEFKVLNDDNKNGIIAREKAIAYAYVPCLKNITGSIFKADCIQSKQIKNIVSGKAKVCNCAADQFKNILAKIAPSEIIRIMKYNPMTLDPMEYYFTSESYYRQSRGLIGKCAYTYTYKKDTKL